MSFLFESDLEGSSKIQISGILRIIVVGLLVLVQLFFVLFFAHWLRGNFIYIFFVLEIISVIIAILLVNDDRSPSYKIAWLCIFMAFPISGHIMFALWGNLFSKRRMEKKIVNSISQKSSTYLKDDEKVRKEFEKKYPQENRVSLYLEKQQFPLFKNNTINYYPFGQDVFEAVFEDIKKAKKFIFLNFFIVGEGALWDMLYPILKDKVKEGVEVKFMYDDFGATLRISKHFKKDLEVNGIDVAVFNPIHKYTDKLYLNYRNHQKIIVIDGNIGYTGGMNLADEYANIIDRFGVWKDSAVRVEGDVVWGFTVIFLQMWELCDKLPKLDYNLYRPTKEFVQNDVFCHMVADGPANNPENPIESLYKQIIYNAKEYLYIATPYLVIEDDLKEALVTAAKSGVDVRIITPFIPDKKNVKILTNYNYGPLLAGGVKIMEYRPGFIHSKMIINEESGIVGTINMDYRSFYLHYECGLFMCNKDAVNLVYDDFISTMKECIEINYQAWKKRPFHIKSYQYILNLFSTLL